MDEPRRPQPQGQQPHQQGDSLDGVLGAEGQEVEDVGELGEPEEAQRLGVQPVLAQGQGNEYVGQRHHVDDGVQLHPEQHQVVGRQQPDHEEDDEQRSDDQLHCEVGDLRQGGEAACPWLVGTLEGQGHVDQVAGQGHGDENLAEEVVPGHQCPGEWLEAAQVDQKGVERLAVGQ